MTQSISLEVLNDLLLMRCREDEGRLIDGRSQLVGQAMAEERNHLLALPAEVSRCTQFWPFRKLDTAGEFRKRFIWRAVGVIVWETQVLASGK